MLEYKSTIVAGVFLVLLSLEHIWPAEKAPVPAIPRIIKNLSFWPINILLSLIIIIPVSYSAAQNTFWHRPDWFQGPLTLIVDILLLDLFIYGWHRAVHEIQFFWRFHEVHHLDEHLDTTSAIRFHFGEIFFAAFLRAIIVIVFAIPFSTVIIFETLVLIFTFFHHSNIALPSRIEKTIAKVIITPSLHWVHHHAVRQDTDSNYGTIFSFWDRLFKSQSATQRFEQMKIGVEGFKDKLFFELLLAPLYKKRPKKSLPPKHKASDE